MSDTDLDTLWQEACKRDERSFGDWMGRVERPIRLYLHRWSRNVDVEVALQETCLRMWVLACDRDEPALTGTKASLLVAIVSARNIARNLARKGKREVPTAPEDMPDISVQPAPDPEPALRRAILACLNALSGRLREVMLSRLQSDGRKPDRELAESLGMQVNSFLQNVVRARKQLDACLDGKGFPAKERVV